MASIQSSIELIDHVSEPVLKMLDAITRVTNSFDNLYTNANRANTVLETMHWQNTGMQNVASQSATAADNINAVSSAAQNAARSIQQTSSAIEKVPVQINQAASGLNTVSSAAQNTSNIVQQTVTSINRVSNATQQTSNAAIQAGSAVRNSMLLAVQAEHTVEAAISRAREEFLQYGNVSQHVNKVNLSCLNEISNGGQMASVAWSKAAKSQLTAVKMAGSAFKTTSKEANIVTKTIGNIPIVYQKIAYMASTAMQKTTEKTQQIGASAQKAVGIFNRVGSAIQTAFTKLTSIGKGTDENTRKQEQFNHSVQAGASQYNALLSRIRTVAATIVSVQGVKMTLGLSDELANTTARLNMLTGSVEETKRVQNQIFAAANRARGSYQEMSDLVGKLGILAGNAFSNTNETIAFAEQLNKQFTISGTSAEGASAATLQLTQALGSGVLRGEELNSVFEQAPTIIQQIAAYLGVSVGEIRNLAAEGTISADIVKNALLSATDETNARFQQMPMTFSQVMTQIKNYALRAFQPVLERFTELANSQDFQMMIQGVIQGLAILGNAAVIVMNKMASGATWVKQNWETIAPILKVVAIALGVVATAYVVYKVAVTAAKIAQLLFNASLWTSPLTWIVIGITALVVVFVLFTEKVLGITNVILEFGRQSTLWLSNVGIAAWTVIKNIGLWCKNLWKAILTLIKNINLWCSNLGRAILTIVKNVNSWCSNLGEAICAIIKNVGLWFANLGNGIWSVLSACANNVGVAFNNAWYSVKAGFLSMVEVILSKAQGLLGGLNSLLPDDMQIGGEGLNNALESIRSSINEANDSMKEYQSLSDAWNTGFHTYEYVDVSAAYQTHGYDSVSDAFHTFDYDSVGDAFHTFDYDSVSDAFHTFDAFQDGWASKAYNTGAEVGAGLHDKITGIWDKIKGLGGNPTSNSSDGSLLSINPNNYLGADLLNAADDVTNASDGLTDSMNALAESNSDLNDTVSMSDDMMRYMRNIAERDAINRFTTAEVKVDFHATNTISNDMDIDGVISALESKIQQALVTAAEGVHL